MGIACCNVEENETLPLLLVLLWNTSELWKCCNCQSSLQLGDLVPHTLAVGLPHHGLPQGAHTQLVPTALASCSGYSLVLHTKKVNKTYYVQEGCGLLVNLPCIPTCAGIGLYVVVYSEYIPYMVRHDLLCHLRRKDQWKLNKLSSSLSR